MNVSAWSRGLLTASLIAATASCTDSFSTAPPPAQVPDAQAADARANDSGLDSGATPDAGAANLLEARGYSAKNCGLFKTFYGETIDAEYRSENQTCRICLPTKNPTLVVNELIIKLDQNVWPEMQPGSYTHTAQLFQSVGEPTSRATLHAFRANVQDDKETVQVVGTSSALKAIPVRYTSVVDWPIGNYPEKLTLELRIDSAKAGECFDVSDVGIYKYP